jgi:hypothetical protein
MSALWGMPPEILLPAQLPQRRASQPELRLYAAVLGTAVDDLRLRAVTDPHRQQHETLAAAARAWIGSDSRAWPFAFRNVCCALGLEPSRVRRRLGVARVRLRDRRE